MDCGAIRPGMSYNIACATALMGKSDEAIDWLKKAFEARFADTETVEKDA